MFFRNTIKELKSDIRKLNKRIEQLECPHPLNEQEFKKCGGYFLNEQEFKKCGGFYYGMRVCNLCGKIMDIYTGNESFMMAQNKQMQEQIKRNKAILRVK